MLALADIDTVLRNVVAPMLERMGGAWNCSETAVTQDHLLVERLTVALEALVKTLDTSTQRPVLVAPVTGGDHQLGMLILAARLARWGYHPVLAAAGDSPEALASRIEAVRPMFVALSVAVAPDSGDATQIVSAYGQALEGQRWVVGGRGASALAELVREKGGIVATEGSDDWLTAVGHFTFAHAGRQEQAHPSA